MLLFKALAPILWATRDDAELWRCRRGAQLCDGYTAYLRTHFLDPIAPEAAALSVQYVTATQTAAALCIILVAISVESTADDVGGPAASAALIKVERWTLETLGAGRLSQLDGAAGLLAASTDELMPFRGREPAPAPGARQGGVDPLRRLVPRCAHRCGSGRSRPLSGSARLCGDANERAKIPRVTAQAA